jgi:hypothetical protein
VTVPLSPRYEEAAKLGCIPALYLHGLNIIYWAKLHEKE